MTKCIAGAVLFFASLWMGSYVLHDNLHAWYSFPALLTFCVLCVTGFMLAMDGVMNG